MMDQLSQQSNWRTINFETMNFKTSVKILSRSNETEVIILMKQVIQIKNSSHSLAADFQR